MKIEQQLVSKKNQINQFKKKEILSEKEYVEYVEYIKFLSQGFVI